MPGFPLPRCLCVSYFQCWYFPKFSPRLTHTHSSSSNWRDAFSDILPPSLFLYHAGINVLLLCSLFSALLLRPSKHLSHSIKFPFRYLSLSTDCKNQELKDLVCLSHNISQYLNPFLVQFLCSINIHCMNPKTPRSLMFPHLCTFPSAYVMLWLHLLHYLILAYSSIISPGPIFPRKSSLIPPTFSGLPQQPVQYLPSGHFSYCIVVHLLMAGFSVSLKDSELLKKSIHDLFIPPSPSTRMRPTQNRAQ